MKKSYLVLQGGARKNGEVSSNETVKEFTNKEEAIKLFNEIRHDKGWNAYYCYTSVELWIINEEGDDIYLDTIVEYYEKQR